MLVTPSLTLVWSLSGRLPDVPEGQTVNKEYYLAVLRHLREEIRRKRPDLWADNSWIFNHDNAPPHSSLNNMWMRVWLKIRKFSFLRFYIFVDKIVYTFYQSSLDRIISTPYIRTSEISLTQSEKPLFLNFISLSHVISKMKLSISKNSLFRL